MFQKNNILCVDALVYNSDQPFDGISESLALNCYRYFHLRELINNAFVCHKYCINESTLAILTLEHLSKSERNKYKTIIIERSSIIKIKQTTDSVSTIIKRSKLVATKKMEKDELERYKMLNEKLKKAKRKAQNLPKIIKPDLYMIPSTSKSREHDWLVVPNIAQIEQAGEESTLIYFTGMDVILHLPIKSKLIEKRYNKGKQLLMSD
ncbi:ComK protein [Granulicatella balaenopterae]|uniref:ComK protein n=1 Tax=Granulicatella balaenopterae TaxID=137733 RepID=A0A1H9NJQ4_9LACT|nr:competence protein ComK [Granulicatella balaenopterae]SER35977.1 ComK protein [Granulicatella balaenopterae]